MTTPTEKLSEISDQQLHAACEAYRTARVAGMNQPESMRAALAAHESRAQPASVTVADVCAALDRIPLSERKPAAPLPAQPASVADGWAMVPRELTPEMHAAFFKTRGEPGWLDKGWNAMLAAVPPEGKQ